MDIDAALSEDNTVQVAELLEPAKNHSFELGLKLNLPSSEVEAIHNDYSSQHNRFINPRRACARVPVCVSVCLSVCLFPL